MATALSGHAWTFMPTQSRGHATRFVDAPLALAGEISFFRHNRKNPQVLSRLTR
jgi:hypothetical protein